MKRVRVMKRTQQFDSIHYMEGDVVYASRIGHSAFYILSKRKRQPVGPTVHRDFLNDLTEWVEVEG